MSKTARRMTITLAVVFLVGGGYAASRFFGLSGGIPKEFTAARLQGALISQNIVNLSNQSVLDLVEIGKLDQNHQFTDALNLTTNVLKKSQDIRDQAVALSGQVETMTKALSQMRSTEARQVALESITNRLALISRLINYSGYLGQLLDSLRSKFGGLSVPKGQSVDELITQINAEVRAINSFNGQATQAMERFDAIVNK